MITIFLSLLVVHFIADFYLQRAAWIQSKIKEKHKSIGLFKHICVHLVLNAVVLWLLIRDFSATYLVSLVAIVLTHYAIDIWKSFQTFKLKYFLIDQIGHIIILAIVALYISGTSITLIIDTIGANLNAKTLAVAAGTILLTKPMSFIVQLSLVNYTQDFEKNEKQKGLSNAGELIGVLERLLVFVLVVSGQLGGVGFLLAAKSVFRFGDMREQKDRKLTEYIMLGTLLSIGSALVVGLAVKSQFN